MGCLITMALQGILDHWLPVKQWVGTASLGRGMDTVQKTVLQVFRAQLGAKTLAYVPNFGSEKLEIYQPNRRLVCPFSFQVHFTCPNTFNGFFMLYCT